MHGYEGLVAVQGFAHTLQGCVVCLGDGGIVHEPARCECFADAGVEVLPCDAAGGGEVVALLIAWDVLVIEDCAEEAGVEGCVVVHVGDGPSLPPECE